MRITDALKGYIIDNLDGFTDKNVVVGKADLSRHDAKTRLCAIVPETSEITRAYTAGSFEVQTRLTVSFLFRGGQYKALVREMEDTADAFMAAVMKSLSLGNSVTGADIGQIEYFYDTGTVEEQATGLDINLTITETRS